MKTGQTLGVALGLRDQDQYAVLDIDQQPIPALDIEGFTGRGWNHDLVTAADLHASCRGHFTSLDAKQYTLFA
jgi:hypothetical protein